MKKNLLLTVALCTTVASYSQEWSSYAIPADAGEGKSWVLQDNVSDEFNYNFGAKNSETSFGDNKWKNFYHNQWDGPGTTYWKYNHVSVDGDNLVLTTSRWDKNNHSPGSHQTQRPS